MCGLTFEAFAMSLCANTIWTISRTVVGATFVQQQYAIQQPMRVRALRQILLGDHLKRRPGTKHRLGGHGVKRTFYDYVARGVPFGFNDGTLAPWAVVASLPFAPEIVLPTIQNYEVYNSWKKAGQYGYKATFNPTFPVQPNHEHGWVSPYHFGINQGPIVLMIENHRSEFLWSMMRQCPYLVTGLRKAGFTGGWLE